MFREWGFLLGEIWILLLLAALLGLLVGWLLWGRRVSALSADLEASRYTLKEKQARISSLEEELRRIRAKQSEESQRFTQDLEERDQKIANMTRQVQEAPRDLSGEVSRWQQAAAQKDGRVKELEAELVARPDLSAELTQCRNLGTQKDSRIAELEAQLSSQSASLAASGAGAAAVGAAAGFHERPAAFQGQDYDGDGVVEGTNEGTKPSTLTAARNGRPDDLKQIKGVGPKLEGLLHSLGFYHFDQVASWGASEVAWVDANLEGFSGRVSRDQWVAQAKILAAGGATEFSKRVDGGDVY